MRHGRTPCPSSPRGAARAPAGAGPPGWAPIGPLLQSAARQWPGQEPQRSPAGRHHGPVQAGEALPGTLQYACRAQANISRTIASTHRGAARCLTAHRCLARPYMQPRPVLVRTTGSGAMQRMRTSVRTRCMACRASITRRSTSAPSSPVQGARCAYVQRSARRMRAPSAPARRSARRSARDAPPSRATPRRATMTASASPALPSHGLPPSPLAPPQPVAGISRGSPAMCPAGHNDCPACIEWVCNGCHACPHA